MSESSVTRSVFTTCSY